MYIACIHIHLHKRIVHIAGHIYIHTQYTYIYECARVDLEETVRRIDHALGLAQLAVRRLRVELGEEGSVPDPEAREHVRA
jgi:hypothetical protein